MDVLSRTSLVDKDANDFSESQTITTNGLLYWGWKKDDKVVVRIKGLEIDSNDPIGPSLIFDLRVSIWYLGGTNYSKTISGWSIIAPNGKTTVEMKAAKDEFSIDIMLRESTNSKRDNKCFLYWAIEYGV